jgi:hypothetical protein
MNKVINFYVSLKASFCVISRASNRSSRASLCSGVTYVGFITGLLLPCLYFFSSIFVFGKRRILSSFRRENILI